MANKHLFASQAGQFIPSTNAVNEEHAPAYALEPRQALAQYAATGCLGRTFYATAEGQLEAVLELCRQVEPEFVAKTAIYCRTRGYMKDMPALLCAWLSTQDARLHEAVFAKVVDSTKMLRTYVQILRSGAAGRKSLGSAPKRLVRDWLAARDEEALFSGSVGQQPSLPDILRMVHPKPGTPCREAFYGYLLGRPHDANALPGLVRQFERFKSGESHDVPDLPLTMLSALPLTAKDWTRIATNASWQTTRMNLNTFARHGVFASEPLTRQIANRLRNAREINRARVFPYQLMTAYQHADAAVPELIKQALHDAMELAIANVPSIDGRVAVCPDVSGSMLSAVTGWRPGATAKVRCIDVAALVAAAVVRKNPSARVLPFNEDVVDIDLNPREPVMVNAQRLAAIGGGGTSCSAPVRLLNQQAAKADLVIFVSDNESWVDAGYGRGTALMAEWAAFRRRNPGARLVCLDIQPYQTTQAAGRDDILNIGGCSDHVFELISAFARGDLEAGHWVNRIAAA